MNSFVLLPLLCLVSFSVACYFPPPATTTMPPMPTTTMAPATTTPLLTTTRPPAITRASTADFTCTGREPFNVILDRIPKVMAAPASGTTSSDVVFSALGQQRAYCYKIVDNNAAADKSTFTSANVIDPVNGATSITISFTSAVTKPINVDVTFYGRAS